MEMVDATEAFPDGWVFVDFFPCVFVDFLLFKDFLLGVTDGGGGGGLLAQSIILIGPSDGLRFCQSNGVGGVVLDGWALNAWSGDGMLMDLTSGGSGVTFLFQNWVSALPVNTVSTGGVN